MCEHKQAVNCVSVVVVAVVVVGVDDAAAADVLSAVVRGFVCAPPFGLRCILADNRLQVNLQCMHSCFVFILLASGCTKILWLIMTTASRCVVCVCASWLGR